MMEYMMMMMIVSSLLRSTTNLKGENYEMFKM